MVKRTQYWEDPRTQTAVRDGSPALAENFADVEQYLLPMERLRTAALHSWGVADGLRVSATPGASGVTVGPGSAVDSAGRQIVITEGGAVVVDQTVDADQIQNVPTVKAGPNGTTVDTTGLPEAEFLLTITWREVLGENDFVNAQAWVHAPWLRLVSPSGFADAGRQVVLARVRLGAGGTVADGGLTVGQRRTAGVPTGRIEFRAPRGTGGGADPLAVEQLPVAELAPGQDGDVVLTLLGGAQPRTALTVEQGTGGTRVAGRLSVTGEATFEGTVTAGEISGASLSVTGAVTAGDVSAADISSSSLSVLGLVKAGDVTAAHISGASLSVSGPVTAGDVSTANLGVAGWLRMGNPGGSQAALVVVDERPDNNWNTAAFQKPSVGPNWSHLHWGATGDWYIRSASSSGRVILQDTGGFVGVGTGTPQANLDVAGALALNGGLALSADSWLRFNQNSAFTDGVYTQGLFTADSINVGGHGGWVSHGFGSLAVVGAVAVGGGVTAGGIVEAFQYRTNGQSWLRGQVYTGEVFGHWDGRANLKLWGSEVFDIGDGWLQLRSGGGRTFLYGEVTVQGALHKPGGGFKIDHPQDPEQKYLSHSFVESPEMVNLYAGTAVTGDDGVATISLPDYFGALNRDHRFQLTTIGELALATVEGEVRDNAFTIRTDKPGVTVSWQVTGVRQDPWAEAHRIAVVEDKPDRERSRFMHPELYGQAEDRAFLPAVAQAPAAELEGGPR